MFTLGPHTARIPDIAVVLAARMGQVPDQDIAIPIAPDLAIEVISPSESVRDAEKRIREYLSAGVQEIWEIHPDMRFVRVRRPGVMQDFEEDQVLTSPVLAGFKVAVDRFFTD